jgi:hypothetical protein
MGGGGAKSRHSCLGPTCISMGIEVKKVRAVREEEAFDFFISSFDT